SVALGLIAFPRWLAWWVAIPGATSLLLFTLTAIGAPFFFPLLLLHVVVGAIALPFAIAWTFWRNPIGTRVAAGSLRDVPLAS
ncbi:MAG TPA: hypothetical protein VGL99_09975, partial [Chloroflexota bacterium]